MISFAFHLRMELEIELINSEGLLVILVGKDGHIYSPIFNGNGYITIPIL